MEWHGTHNIGSRSYTCGYCNNIVASRDGYFPKDGLDRIYICPHCVKPSYFPKDGQVPGVPFGDAIANLPQDVEHAYSEARRCMTVSAFSSAALMTRKLLMHIAVSKGDAPGKKFVEYVDFLVAKHLIPPDAGKWVDHIRMKGNEATHELPAISKSDAEELIIFVEMLLRLVYEFPARLVLPKQ